jgi:hypothetical protein
MIDVDSNGNLTLHSPDGEPLVDDAIIHAALDEYYATHGL